MSKYDEDNQDFWKLDRLLMTYRRQIGQKESIERRKRDIKYQFGGYGNKNKAAGSTAILTELDKMDEILEEQKMKAIKSRTTVNEILDFIPQDHESWNIMQCRYIDGYGWEKACRECYVGRRTAIRIWKRSMKHLLTFKKIQKMIDDMPEKF